jgi:hypothetical protein
MTIKTLNSLIVAAILVASATVGIQVAASPTSAPVVSSDDSIALMVPIVGGLKLTTSPVVRITR